ncbi:rhodanese-like domain-containing protein [Thiothrix lacustris]|uniref:rhodanese-like domain-containing protein n=1 Tax=Thiothrix lacustris TaxID=525917 RepID=UPI00056F8F24|nr:rhodanese-like domain-containing protein [Thiothrix lacustris]
MLRDYAEVRAKLLNREEIAFLDVREEAPHAEGHPLFAANFPLVRLELDAATKLPRRDVPIVTFDNGEGLAEQAAERLLALGYSDVAVFAGGLDGWKAAGGEVFIDVNVPSKAFGELMEAACHTPSFSAQEVKAMLDAKADMVIVDVRRFDEYQTMSIPTGISVPGAEVVLRVADLVRKPTTQIIVNCAGRTRSLIGTQSLINAGFPNPIAALRNGTIGWLLAQQQLDFGQTRRFSATSAPSAGIARQRARAVADRAGVKRASKQDWATWMQQDSRTTYCFDVRNVAEYATGHLPGCYPIPGGQLVQETEMYAPVRGARLLLVDDDGTRANMSASWLAQMAWDVYVIDGLTARDFSETGYEKPKDSPPMRRYKRPYEGTDAPPLAMQAYLDWEFGLIEQLRRDGTHHFQPLKAD